MAWTYAGNGGPAQAKFEVQVATDQGFGHIINDSGATTSSTPSYSIPASVSLTAGSTYYWQVKVNDGTTWSPYATSSFRWDVSAPGWNDFTAPVAQVDQKGTSYPFAWNAVTDAASGINHYELVPQSAGVASPNVCGTSWSNMTTTQSIGTNTSFTVGSLVNNTCYRLTVRAQDNAGNYTSYFTSTPVLVDTLTLTVPAVGDNCAAIGSCYRTGNTIYFQPAAAKQITLTSTAIDTPSGIASSTFGSLSSPSGWTQTPATVTGNPASASLT